MIFPDTFLFCLALGVKGAILFLLIYFVITLSDLECDYINAQVCCNRLNQWIVPKLCAHAFLTAMLTLHGHWFLMLFNGPMVGYLAYELISVPRGNVGIYDPTEVHNQGRLKRHLRNCMIHLGFYLVLFFIYLYCLIVSLLKGDPINRKDEEEYRVFD